jgi:16S rRNA (cytosine967-C5)-methyltransferase
MMPPSSDRSRSKVPRRPAHTRPEPAAPAHVETARSVAYSALLKVDHDGAYANLQMQQSLAACGLDARDKAYATELVYGATRMRRACDFAIDRHILKPPQPLLRTLLRLGAYQLLFTSTAPHAAVSETVELAPERARGFVNAILRNIARTPPVWPNEATRLSYPDWIVRRLTAELGADDAVATMETMNLAPDVDKRSDGYVQGRASQWVGDLVEARPGERVLDMCAAPGGKATALAASGAEVIAADVHPGRARLVFQNARATQTDVGVLVADGAALPFADCSFDRVLVDAPCSGLGVLRRRADARWRIEEKDVVELAALQQRLLDEASRVTRPGGTLIYSVCTLTAAESINHRFPGGWTALDPPSAPWQAYGDGGRVLPHETNTDGMTILRYRRPS